MTEQEAKDRLKQARTKHTNCQIYLVGAIIFAASTTAVLFMETYRKAQLDLQVRALKDENFYQSMKIRVLEYDVRDLKIDTAWYKTEIKALKSEVNLWKTISKI